MLGKKRLRRETFAFLAQWLFQQSFWRQMLRTRGRAALSWHLGQSWVLIKALSRTPGTVRLRRYMHRHTRECSLRKKIFVLILSNYPCRKMSDDSVTPYKRASIASRWVLIASSDWIDTIYDINKKVCFSNIAEKVDYASASDSINALDRPWCDLNGIRPLNFVRNELHRRPGFLWLYSDGTRVHCASTSRFAQNGERFFKAGKRVTPTQRRQRCEKARPFARIKVRGALARACSPLAKPIDTESPSVATIMRRNGITAQTNSYPLIPCRAN